MAPLTCVVCFEPYNDSSRLPRQLACGHSLCSSCINSMTMGQNAMECPTCRTHFPAPIGQTLTADTFVTNYALLEMVGSGSKHATDPLTEYALDPDDLHLESVISYEGCWGEVWAGTLVCENNRVEQVAVKMLPAMGSTTEQEKVRAEVQILGTAAKRCHWACKLYGTCTKDNKLCIVMRRYQQSLRQLILATPGKKLPAAVAVQMGADISAGLHELHAAGIVMADVKPSNVLLDDLGKPVLSDFGISRITEATMGQYLPTSVQGSPNYLSPEGWSPSDFGGITNKTDIWALGCTLVEMFSGQPPWKGSTMNQIMVHVCMKKQAPAIPEEVPDSLREIVAACFQYQPQDRPTAFEMYEALNSFYQLQKSPSDSGTAEVAAIIAEARARAKPLGVPSIAAAAGVGAGAGAAAAAASVHHFATPQSGKLPDVAEVKMEEGNGGWAAPQKPMPVVPPPAEKQGCWASMSTNKKIALVALLALLIIGGVVGGVVGGIVASKSNDDSPAPVVVSSPPPPRGRAPPPFSPPPPVPQKSYDITITASATNSTGADIYIKLCSTNGGIGTGNVCVPPANPPTFWSRIPAGFPSGSATRTLTGAAISPICYMEVTADATGTKDGENAGVRIETIVVNQEAFFDFGNNFLPNFNLLPNTTIIVPPNIVEIVRNVDGNAAIGTFKISIC